MKFELTVGKKEYIAAGRLMSAGAHGRQTRKVLFAVLAVISLAAAVGLLFTNAAPILISLLFGFSALFIWLFFRTKSKWETPSFIDNGAVVKPIKAVYGFYEDGFSSRTAGHEVRLSWSKMENWGYFEEYLYIEFAGKQFAVMERAQLGVNALKEIEDFLSEKKEKNDFE